MSEIVITADARKDASFTVANRARRLLWTIVYRLLFRPSPWFMHGWRSWLLRRFGASVGRDCHIYPGVVIWAPWNLVLGNEVGVASGTILYSQATITLGDRVVVSQGAHLCTGTHDYESPSFQLKAMPITVEREAWIAAEAFLHPGVTVGEGAVIGARAVVVSDQSAWSVCAGHPCRVIKPRQRRS